jgi:DNA-binding LacI/PurR family transcriptional regulator
MASITEVARRAGMSISTVPRVLNPVSECRGAGLAVPGDVSVVGFGNTAAAEHAVPALTTVSMPRHQLGIEAMQAVVDALALEQPRVLARRLPFHLVIRESSGPAP